MGYSPAAIRALGGGASQFNISTGAAKLSVRQGDLGLFAGDDWRIRPNILLSLGLRYEAQTNIHDWRGVAPRLAIAWNPASSHGKTVLRAGFGVFYDRFPLANVLTARRYNGVVQQQYVVTNPDFFPQIPPPASLADSQFAQVTENLSPSLRAPYILQSALTLERQLTSHATVAVTYTNSHGLHMLRSRDINAPLPGTYNPSEPGSGVYPLGMRAPVFSMESTGLYNQDQLIANFKASLHSGLSLFGFYLFNHARSNTDGVNTFPANPYDLSGEYGPASTDIRHRVSFGGSVNLRWNIRVSPFLVAQSGTPFDITTGNDPYGTTLLNARPGIATDPARPGTISTRYGLLDPNPLSSESLISRNYGRGPSQISLNMRLAKTLGFGAEGGKGPKLSAAAKGGGGATNPENAAAGKGLLSLIGAPLTDRRYNMTVALSARNLLNHTNPGPITGNITSPLFGRANQIAGTPNGEGFFETASNRRLELQIRFSF